MSHAESPKVRPQPGGADADAPGTLGRAHNGSNGSNGHVVDDGHATGGTMNGNGTTNGNGTINGNGHAPGVVTNGNGSNGHRVGTNGHGDGGSAVLTDRAPAPAVVGARELADEVTGPHRARLTDRQHIAILILTDFIAVAVALPLALLLLSWLSGAGVNSLSHFGHNAALDAWLPLGAVVALGISGSYRSARLAIKPSTASEIKDIFVALGGGVVLALALADVAHAAIHGSQPDATQLIGAVIIAVAMIVILRMIVGSVLSSVNVTRVLVVGSGELVDRIELYLRIRKGLEMVGRVEATDFPGPGALGTMRDLPYLVERYDVDRVIVAFPERVSQDSIAILRDLQSRIHIAVVPRYFDLVSWRSALTDLSGLPLIEVPAAQMSLWDRAAKRTVDLAVSTVVLLLFAPVMLAIALGIKLTSPGPVFFRQERLGRERSPFVIFKFRTMREEPSDDTPTDRRAVSEEDARQPLKVLREKSTELERATGIGAFLRRTGLDELPQLFNVLAGQMSIVGPRPFVEEESEHLSGWAARRFEVRPGITGLWQVSGRNELSTEDLRQLDFVYVASWSLWWDLKILWDTPRAMLRGLGAY